ncbi:MAG: hypothetical protein H0W50_05580, partial [Parachlamydiaceae bacterium]|nr:hypothetical protein [Parachlamydiaceae bacterium]
KLSVTRSTAKAVYLVIESFRGKGEQARNLSGKGYIETGNSIELYEEAPEIVAKLTDLIEETTKNKPKESNQLITEDELDFLDSVSENNSKEDSLSLKLLEKTINFRVRVYNGVENLEVLRESDVIKNNPFLSGDLYNLQLLLHKMANGMPLSGDEAIIVLKLKSKLEKLFL